MHPAPNLLEAPPRPEDISRSNSIGGGHSPANSPPPLRKDTISSISTQGTSVSSLSASSTFSSADTANTVYGPDAPGPAGVPSPSSQAASPPEQSPPATLHHQTIFSVKDGADMAGINRKASRRRTGPLSAQQREKAALIRKLGACHECRRRRVACTPAHHGMSWEDAARKYRQDSSPSVQDILPMVSGGRPLSPAQSQLAHVLNPNVGQGTQLRTLLSNDSEIMDLDQPMGTVGTPPGRPPLSDARMGIRTPLPAGPGPIMLPRQPDQMCGGPRVYPEKQMPLPGIESLGGHNPNLQLMLERVVASRTQSRYAAAQVLLLSWQDDLEAGPAVDELAQAFSEHYRFDCEVHRIPHESSWKWLSRVILAGSEDSDRRDVLKIVYYNGYSHLDANREMVLASSKDKQGASTIRWSGIQQALEENIADTLILMDTAYFPSSSMATKTGVLELIAASASEDHLADLGRGTFTQVLAEQLRARATQDRPLTAAELHSIVMSKYPNLVQDRNPEREIITSFPAPLHLQTSKNTRLPSILLAPLPVASPHHGTPPRMYNNAFGGSIGGGAHSAGSVHGSPHFGGSVNGMGGPVSPTGPMLSLTILIPDNALEQENWVEWLRSMPEGVRDVSAERAYPSPSYH